MKKHWLVWAGLAFILASVFNVHAQETATPVQSATPDSIVQLTAQSQGLNLVSPDDLPEYGTFWMVTTDGLTAPMPCPPQDPSLPVYAITNGQFIVDATDGKVTTEGQQSVADAVAALAGDVEDLINQVQTPPSQPMTGSRMAGGTTGKNESRENFYHNP